MNMRKFAILLLLLGIILFSSGSVLTIKDEKALIDSTKLYNNLFIDGLPKDDVTKHDIYKVKQSLADVSNYNKIKKDKMSQDLKQYEKYIEFRKEILSYYTNEALDTKVTNDDIHNYELKIATLSSKYKEKLQLTIDDMHNQRNNLDEMEKRIRNIYYEGDLTNVKIEISVDEVENIKIDLAKLPQTEFVNKYTNILNEAINKINEREAINNSWVRLYVPYISQNNNGVLNGCEAASLLMALQYKGYLNGTSLYDYSTNMPKSNNPYEGFTHDIYGKEPENVPHWIAPEPLAKYGRDTSGNQNIENGTGKSIDELDNEVDNGNPVIIYLTAKFNDPTDWVEDAPVNLHVLLLVGYNRITGHQILIDPWTYENGRTTWTVSKYQLETIYNAVGQKSVIVR